MNTILIQPKDEKEEQLVMDLMERMNIEAEQVTEVHFEGEDPDSDFASDFELNVAEVKSRWPRMKNLQRTRELLYEMMRSGYARLQKI